MAVFKIHLVAAWALVMLSSGCATVRVSMYEAEEIDEIEAWHVAFADQPGRYEQTIGTRQGQTTTIAKDGHAPVDLQLRDDVYFRIRDSYRITVVTDRESAEGLILLRPLHFTAGGYKSLQIVLADPDGETFARIRVKNGERTPIIKDNEKFAAHCGDAIIKVLTNPYLH